MRHPPPRPSGNSAEAIFVQAVWDCLWDPKTSLFCDSPTLHFDKTPKGYVPVLRRAAGSGGTGWFFGSKIELGVAPYPYFQAQQVIHIQPTHVIVTTGIVDAAKPTGPLVTSCAGYWVAKQMVPAQTTVGGVSVWNLPQYPYPMPTNMDDPTNFWIYLGEMTC
jgi:hypothetical protein